MASNFSTLAIGGHPNSGLSLNTPYPAPQASRSLIRAEYCPHQTGAQPLPHGPSNQSNDDEVVMAQRGIL